MKSKIKKFAKEIVTFIIVLTIASNLISLYKSQDLSDKKLDIKSIKLIDDSIYNFENDKPVLIHFWATWCPICRVEAPNINILSKYYNVITIAVKSKDKENIKKWMNDKGYNYKVVNDNLGELASVFNVPAYPTTFIYDKDKNLVFSEVGYTSTFGLWLRMLWAEF